MEEPNVERWRVLIEAFRAGPDSSWEEWLVSMQPGYHPDLVWDASSLKIPGLAGVYHGPEGASAFWREWLSAWKILKFDYTLVGAGESVVMLLDQKMRGLSSGIEVSTGPYGQVSKWRDGLMVHWRTYPSQKLALEAVGLTERDVPPPEAGG